MENFITYLTKLTRERRTWASKKKISCFRVYDRELPDFPFTVDLFEDALSVSEFLRPHQESLLGTQMAPLKEALSLGTGVPTARIFFKTREKQQGKAQYEKYDEKEDFSVVREGGLKFLINLSDYLDNGLFLDHRWTRSYVRDAAAGKKVLNLFAYTGSFSVYAAHGGAFQTTTVDLSPTYLDWAKKNFELNHLMSPSHQFLRRDVLEFLKSEKKTYDLIIMDPPTFSNSKKMLETLDIQRDHAWMIERCLSMLAPDGLLFFSNNFQKFKLEETKLPPCKLKVISNLTVPKDFKKGAHQCFLITHPEGPQIDLVPLDS